jgi:hypothetical protein
MKEKNISTRSFDIVFKPQKEDQQRKGSNNRGRNTDVQEDFPLYLFLMGLIIVESPTYVSRIETYMRVREKVHSVGCERGTLFGW